MSTLNNTAGMQEQLKKHLETINNGLKQQDINAVLTALYAFSLFLSEQFPNQKVEKFINELELSALNIDYTHSEFAAGLYDAVLGVKFEVAEQMESDQHLRRIVSNSEAAILCFYKIINVKATDLAPEMDVVDRDYLPKVNAFVCQKIQEEEKEKVDLINNMQACSAEFKRLKKMCTSKTTQEMLEHLASGLDGVTSDVENKSLHQIKEEYARAFVTAHKELPDEHNLGKDDVRFIRIVRQTIIKAIVYLVPKHIEKTLVGRFVSPWLNLVKMKLEMYERDANRELIESHKNTTSKISTIKVGLGLPAKKANNDSKENVQPKSNDIPVNDRKLIEVPPLTESLHCNSLIK